MNIQNANESSSTLTYINNSIRDLHDGQKVIDDKMADALDTVKTVSDDFSRIDDRIQKVESKQEHDMKRRNEVERKIKTFEGVARAAENDIITSRQQNVTIENHLKIIDNAVGKVHEYFNILEVNCKRDSE